LSAAQLDAGTDYRARDEANAEHKYEHHTARQHHVSEASAACHVTPELRRLTQPVALRQPRVNKRSGSVRVQAQVTIRVSERQGHVSKNRGQGSQQQ
jgi:hypothetical protein